EREPDLAEQADDARGGEHDLPAQGRAQLLTVEKLHDQRPRPLVRLAERQHGSDVRALELRAHLELPPEALDGDGVARDIGPQDLDRDVTVEARVERLVDAPRASIGDTTADVVALEQELADAGIVRIRWHRRLRDGAQGLAVRGAVARIFRV